MQKRNKVVYGWYGNNIPFYIGLGSISRSQRLDRRNPYCTNKRLKAEKEKSFEVRILYENLTLKEAQEIEISLISLYGRKDLETGLLTNLTDGGEGTKNRIFTKEHRQKLSEANRGRVYKPSTIEKLRKAFTGSGNPRSKPVKTPEGVFESCRLAAKKLKLSSTTISKYARKNINGFSYV